MTHAAYSRRNGLWDFAVTYFCFLHSRPERTPHMEPLDADSVEEAKAQARRLLREHTSAHAARVYFGADEVAFLENEGRAS